MSYKEKKANIIPLFIIVLFNLYTAESVKPDFEIIIYMVIWSVVEEIIFRGVLLRCLVKWGVLFGIITSSGLFAVSHLFNLLQHRDYIYTILQVLCAFFIGICYAAVAVQYHSLLPGILAHVLTNLTGIYSLASEMNLERTIGLCVCIVIYAIYGIFLCKNYV